MILTTTISALLAVTGAVLGSCSATAGLRLARAEQALTGRSHCDGCGTPLGFIATMPVASFIYLGGACSSCGSKIDGAHLLGELSGLVVVVTAMAVAPLSRALVLVFLGLALLMSVVHDSRTHRSRNLLTMLVVLPAGVLSLTRSSSALLTGCLAAAVAFFLLAGLRRSTRTLLGEPLLEKCEVRLFAALALWLGAATPWMAALAMGLGLFGRLAWSSGRGRARFGPYVAAAAWVVGIVQEMAAWPIPS